MSAGHWREIEKLQERVADLELSLRIAAGGLTGLQSRIEALEAKRKPGRPAKSEERSDE